MPTVYQAQGGLLGIGVPAGAHVPVKGGAGTASGVLQVSPVRKGKGNTVSLMCADRRALCPPATGLLSVDLRWWTRQPNCNMGEDPGTERGPFRT